MPYSTDKEDNHRRKRSTVRRDKEVAALRHEQEESLKPANHAFVSQGPDQKTTCFWCKEPLSAHQSFVDCSSGVRKVITAA
jgi:hypothetical protein